MNTIGDCKCLTHRFKRNIVSYLDEDRANHASYAEAIRLNIRDGKVKSSDTLGMASGTIMTQGAIMELNFKIAEELETLIEEVRATPVCPPVLPPSSLFEGISVRCKKCGWVENEATFWASGEDMLICPECGSHEVEDV